MESRWKLRYGSRVRSGLGSLKKAKKEKNEKHLKQWLNAECIASDDPRLGEK